MDPLKDAVHLKLKIFIDQSFSRNWKKITITLQENAAMAVLGGRSNLSNFLNIFFTSARDYSLNHDTTE